MANTNPQNARLSARRSMMDDGSAARIERVEIAKILLRGKSKYAEICLGMCLEYDVWKMANVVHDDKRNFLTTLSVELRSTKFSYGPY